MLFMRFTAAEHELDALQSKVHAKRSCTYSFPFLIIQCEIGDWSTNCAAQILLLCTARRQNETGGAEPTWALSA